jgi:hypothetical protein
MPQKAQHTKADGSMIEVQRILDFIEAAREEGWPSVVILAQIDLFCGGIRDASIADLTLVFLDG